MTTRAQSYTLLGVGTAYTMLGVGLHLSNRGKRLQPKYHTNAADLASSLTSRRFLVVVSTASLLAVLAVVAGRSSAEVLESGMQRSWRALVRTLGQQFVRDTALAGAVTSCLSAAARVVRDEITEATWTTVEVKRGSPQGRYVELWLAQQPEFRDSSYFLLSLDAEEYYVHSRAADEGGGDGDEEKPDVAFTLMPNARALQNDPVRLNYRGAFLEVTTRLCGRNAAAPKHGGKKIDRADNAPSSKEECYVISVWGRDTSVLGDILSEGRALREEGLKRQTGTMVYRLKTSRSWHGKEVRPRSIGSVVLPEGEAERLVADARRFVGREQWYVDRGIPYRRGYMFHGVPGCGKSSLVFALAAELRLPIYILSLSPRQTVLDDSSLAALLEDLPHEPAHGMRRKEKSCIVLLEDIDSLFLAGASAAAAAAVEDSAGAEGEGGDEQERGGRSSSSGGDDVRQDGPGARPVGSAAGKAGSDAMGALFGKPSKAGRAGKGRPRDRYLSGTLSYAGLLNAIDGVAAAEGRILIMTTNHPELLDGALVRPGRIDRKVEFKHATRIQARQMFLNFFTSEYVHSENGSAVDGAVGTPTVSAGRGTTALDGRLHPELCKRADEFSQRVRENEFTPADIQGWFTQTETSSEVLLRQEEFMGPGYEQLPTPRITRQFSSGQRGPPTLASIVTE